MVKTKKKDDRLNVLVVEDNPIHQKAAQILLADYNLTIAKNFDRAADTITGGSSYSPYRFEGVGKTKIDVVITDLLFPQGRGDCMADKSRSSWLEKPFGYPIALMAVKEGIPYVAIVSAGNHHEDPMAYTIDFFQDERRHPHIFVCGSSKLAIIDSYNLEPTMYLKDCGTELAEHGEYAKLVKNYKAVMDLLLK